VCVHRRRTHLTDYYDYLTCIQATFEVRYCALQKDGCARGADGLADPDRLHGPAPDLLIKELEQQLKSSTSDLRTSGEVGAAATMPTSGALTRHYKCGNGSWNTLSGCPSDSR
jgi:hypothetical protein